MGPQGKCNFWGSQCPYPFHSLCIHPLTVSPRHLDFRYFLLFFIKAFQPFPNYLVSFLGSCSNEGSSYLLPLDWFLLLRVPTVKGGGVQPGHSTFQVFLVCLFMTTGVVLLQNWNFILCHFFISFPGSPAAWPCDTQSFCENWEGYWQFGSCCSCLCMQRT